MRTINAKKVRDSACLEALLSILTELYEIKVRMNKPRLSLTYEIMIDGKDENKAYATFMIFAAKAGWKITS